MWDTPIYKFKVDENSKTELLIDVTGSAPNFDKPGKQLEGTFDTLLEGLNPKETKILDFGAAKLRNTIYLLEKGFTVYSCEFKDLFNRSKQANQFLETARKYSNFKELVFPDDFINFEEKFDVVLLINVLNVMPVPLERLCVLALCREKMRENGRLLWYTQHGAYSEEDAVTKLFDGLVTGKGRKFHMFYRDFSRKEIHDMLMSTGFSFNSDYKFATAGSNQAYVFNANGDILVDSTLGLTELLRKGSRQSLKTIERKVRWGPETAGEKSTGVKYETKLPTKIATPKEIDILEQYSLELDRIKPGGKKRASRYHQLIFNILCKIFCPQLKNPQKEEKINQSRKRVDMTLDNKANSGFFKDLRDTYNIPAPIIFIECKNYSNALETPEYDQIEGRLNKRRGMFGIIVCRHIGVETDVVNHCRDLVRENPGAEKYVVVLDDQDIKKMVQFKRENNDSEIDKLLENKYRKLIL